MGRMAGGDIETYLLEKSRVTYQSPNERSYHIFYFLITHEVDLHEVCHLGDDIYAYPLMSLGKVTVESIDDAEEMEVMDQAFDILGFTEEEKYDVYKISPACMILSQLEFTGHGDVSSPKSLTAGQSINDFLYFGENGADDLYDRFCQPKFKVNMCL